MASNGFKPLVTSATTAQSLNVRSIMDAMDEGTYLIPDYQRDSAQWSAPKRSLFIESIINNLTIPPLTVYPEDDEDGIEIRQVIDGQQRLTTIREYLKNDFALSSEDDVEYSENVSALIQNKRFSELSPKIQRQIRNYTVNLIVLPKDMALDLRLEIFRRINEGGVPLSPHDLRLATFGSSARVWFVRLVGIFEPGGQGPQRMLGAAKSRFGLEYPWADNQFWNRWWSESRHAIGQTPSEAFLFYIIARDLANLNTLLGNNKSLRALGLQAPRSTTSVLDIYCAHLQREERDSRSAQILASLDTMKAWFEDFQLWFNWMRNNGIRPSSNSARKVALFIAGATSAWGTPDKIPEWQWEDVELVLTKGPRTISKELHVEYPEVRGRWPGQERQIDAIFKICQQIATKQAP